MIPSCATCGCVLKCNGHSPEGSWKGHISQCARWTWACCGCPWSSLVGSPPGSHGPQKYVLLEREVARYKFFFFCWTASVRFISSPLGVHTEPLTVKTVCVSTWGVYLTHVWGETICGCSLTHLQLWDGFHKGPVWTVATVGLIQQAVQHLPDCLSLIHHHGLRALIWHVYPDHELKKNDRKRSLMLTQTISTSAKSMFNCMKKWHHFDSEF